MKSKDDIGLIEFLHHLTLYWTLAIGVAWIIIFGIFMMVFIIAWDLLIFINFLLISLLEFLIAFTHFSYHLKKSKKLLPKGRFILIITGSIGFIGSFIPIGTDGYVTFYLTGLHPIGYWFFWFWLFPIFAGILDWYFYRKQNDRE